MWPDTALHSIAQTQTAQGLLCGEGTFTPAISPQIDIIKLIDEVKKSPQGVWRGKGLIGRGI
jgi:hypothetical protein